MKNALHRAAKAKKKTAPEIAKTIRSLDPSHHSFTVRIRVAYQMGGWDEVDSLIRRHVLSPTSSRKE